MLLSLRLLQSHSSLPFVHVFELHLRYHMSSVAQQSVQNATAGRARAFRRGAAKREVESKQTPTQLHQVTLLILTHRPTCISHYSSKNGPLRRRPRKPHPRNNNPIPHPPRPRRPNPNLNLPLRPPERAPIPPRDPTLHPTIPLPPPEFSAEFCRVRGREA